MAKPIRLTMIRTYAHSIGRAMASLCAAELSFETADLDAVLAGLRAGLAERPSERSRRLLAHLDIMTHWITASEEERDQLLAFLVKRPVSDGV